LTADREVKKCRFDNFGGFFSSGATDIIYLLGNLINQEDEKMAVEMGQIVRRLRKEYGLKQEELGKGIISKSGVSRLENGHEPTSILVLQMLLKRLDASLEPFELVVSGREYEDLKNLAKSGLVKTTVISENDILREMRLAKGISQEELCDDVCARETISNIEHGRKPNRQNMQALLERLGELPCRYYGYIESTDYAAYRLAQQYQIELYRDLYVAECFRVELKGWIDNENPVNKQFLESSELMEKQRLRKVGPEEMLTAMERCLRYTMPEYDGLIYRIPYRQEVVIIQKIIECLKNLGKTEAATQLEKIFTEKIEKKLIIS